MTTENFSNWLRKELEKRDWSQADLARRSGVSTAQIARILSGERGIGAASLQSIAKALKIPSETIYRAAGLLPPVSEEEALIQEIMHDFNELPPDEQINVAEYVKFRRRLAEEREQKESKTRPRPI